MDDLNKNEINSLRTWLGAGAINIFGRPFSGKDTQCKRLARLLNAAHIGGGDIIRGNSEAVEINKIIGQGNLVPQAAFLTMVLPHLQKNEYKNKPLVLNSIGRWHGEEEPVMKVCASSGHPLKAAVYLDISEKEAYKRFDASRMRYDRGDRSDDQRHILATRLNEFKTKTLPVIDFYQEQGLLININGTVSENQVTTAILTALSLKAT